MKENKTYCQDQGRHHQVRYHPYSKLPSKQVLEELTNDFPDVDLSQNPIKGKMGDILQILFAMVIQETLNCEGHLQAASSDYSHTQAATITTPHLNIPNDTTPQQCNDQTKMEEQEDKVCGAPLDIQNTKSEPLDAVLSTSCALTTETNPIREEPESE